VPLEPRLRALLDPERTDEPEEEGADRFEPDDTRDPPDEVPPDDPRGTARCPWSAQASPRLKPGARSAHASARPPVSGPPRLAPAE
jgi:hypothetical protein